MTRPTDSVAQGAEHRAEPGTSRRPGRWGRPLGWIAVCVVLVVSRLALTPRYLITFDEINFAMAIDKFDPNLHQPQPPGYPLFVGLLKLLSFVLTDIETLFLVAALLVSALSLLLLWWLSGMIAGPKQRAIAPLLLLFNPPFWLSALTNPVRLTGAAGALAVASCVWLACRDRSAKWLWLAAGILGLSAGFRPMLVVVLTPMLLWAAWQIRVRWGALGVAVLCFAAGIGAWLPSLIRASGGWLSYFYTLSHYSQGEFSQSSLFWGASLANGLKMAWRAVVWSCLGALSWLWIIPLLARRAVPAGPARAASFLAIWFFPGLFFYATFHVADPDHTLAIVPATCIAGALAIEEFARDKTPAKRTALILFCVLANVFLFFKPINRAAKASVYYSVQWLGNEIAHTIDDVGELQTKGPVTVVFDEVTTGWRQLSYYAPSTPLVVLVRGSGGAVAERHIIDRQITVRENPGGVVLLPSCGTWAWIDRNFHPMPGPGIPILSARPPLFFAAAKANESFELLGFHFKSGSGPCESESRSNK